MQLKRNKVKTPSPVFGFQVICSSSIPSFPPLYFYRLTLTFTNPWVFVDTCIYLMDALWCAGRCGKCFIGTISCICPDFIPEFNKGCHRWLIDWSKIWGKYSFIKQTSYYLALLCASHDFMALLPYLITACYLLCELLEDKDCEFSLVPSVLPALNVYWTNDGGWGGAGGGGQVL